MVSLARPTVSSVSVLDLYESLRDLGFLHEQDGEELLPARSDLARVEGRCPADTVHRLWQRAIERGADAHVGLWVGERLNDQYRGMLSNLIISAASVREVIALFEQFLPVMSQVDVVSVEPVAEGLRLSYGFTEPRFYNSLSIGRSLSASVAWVRYLTGQPVTPLEAGFRLGSVNRPDEYQRVFGANCHFGAAKDYLVLAAADLDLPLRYANDYVHTVIRDRVEDVQRVLAGTTPVSRATRTVIEADLHRGLVSADHVASQLNVSRQTLHRRLQGEGQNFRRLVAEVRRERAERYLREGRGRIERLSELLGYSEPSAFFKAFRSWFGCSPRQFAARTGPLPPG